MADDQSVPVGSPGHLTCSAAVVHSSCKLNDGVYDCASTPFSEGVVIAFGVPLLCRWIQVTLVVALYIIWVTPFRVVSELKGMELC
jgi:hypothetical protein